MDTAVKPRYDGCCWWCDGRCLDTAVKPRYDEHGECMKKQQQTRLVSKVEDNIKKKDKAETEKKSLMAQTVFLGTLGFLFILPVVGGAYLGLWLDERFSGYSISWTVTFILLGVFVGALNVYLFVKER
jgi:ATP synthase protein I